MPVICFNKCDLVDQCEQQRLLEIYRPAGFPVFLIFQTGKKFGKQPAQFLPLDIFRNLKRAKARRIRQKSLFIQPKQFEGEIAPSRYENYLAFLEEVIQQERSF